MFELISYRTIASGSKGRENGTANEMASPAKPHIPQEHTNLIAQVKTRKKFFPLEAPIARAFQSGHNPLVPASTNSKGAIDPSVDRVKGRACRVTPYHPDVRHDVSSGSEYEPSSVCLAAMIHEFMEKTTVEAKCGRSRCNCQIGTCDGIVEPREDDHEDSKSTLGGELFDILQGLVACTSEEEHRLLRDVKLKAVRLAKHAQKADKVCEAEGAECSKGCMKRALMKSLRDAGYNSAICKSKSEHNGGFFGGYHYIDVLLQDSHGKEQRFIVDIEFRCQFEIARPTDQYTSILQELPMIYVGKPERLQQIVNLMSEAVKTSLRKRRMPLPPWRNTEYMKAKWFSPYKRTTNAASKHQRSRARLVSGELHHTAMKGFAWDFEFTNNLGAQVGRGADLKGMLGFHKAGIGSCNTLNFVEEGLSTEAWATNRPRINPNQITVRTTDWQPPAVSRRYLEKMKKIAVLGFMLKESGLTNPITNPQKPLYPGNKIGAMKQATAAA
ncbi:hypothetical protein O6H91_04G080500 [Diphasiastrum complanatum]|uniref:Uncharacterized protein n=1 Tax=Diphasiastrum complanatum TaxID=34168 RepID=A0ACC2DYV0_DIPCM|nr:hypothetical protein O6H91_04G080500 [Diphasiastrum complanatum]